MFEKQKKEVEEHDFEEVQEAPEPEPEPIKQEVSIEQVPYHELKRRAQEVASKFGFHIKSTFTKDQLIYAIKEEKDPEPKKERAKAPVLQDSAKEVCIPMLPKEIEPQLKDLAEKGLTWDIDEESGCVNFSRDIKTCANLDQSANNILRTAREAFSKSRPVEKGNPLLGYENF